MSNISNRHTVQPFTAGESKALSGQRLAKVGYKQTKAMADKGEVAPKSICVSVPFLVKEQIVDNLDALLPHIGNWLEGVQDNVIRSIYEGRKYDLQSVSDEEISVLQCINWLESESSGGRITKEYLDAWFVANMQDGLYILIAEKLGFVDANTDEGIEISEDQDVVISRHLAGYKGLLVSLAGKSPILDQKQINGLRKALEICAPEADQIVSKLSGRLDQIEKESRQLLVDLL